MNNDYYSLRQCYSQFSGSQYPSHYVCSFSHSEDTNWFWIRVAVSATFGTPIEPFLMLLLPEFWAPPADSSSGVFAPSSNSSHRCLGFRAFGWLVCQGTSALTRSLCEQAPSHFRIPFFRGVGYPVAASLLDYFPSLRLSSGDCTNQRAVCVPF